MNMELASASSSQTNDSNPKRSNKQIPIFLVKVYEILDDNKHNDSISWSDDGESIVIKNTGDFTQNILPLLFNHNNLASFIRQLNMYNFRKMKSENGGRIVYFHPYFKKNKRDLLSRVERKKNYFKKEKSTENKTFSSCNNREEEINHIDAENKALKQAHETLQQQLHQALESVKMLEHNQKRLFEELQLQKRQRTNFDSYVRTYGANSYNNMQPAWIYHNQHLKASTFPSFNNYDYDLTRASTDKEPSFTSDHEFEESNLKDVYEINNNNKIPGEIPMYSGSSVHMYNGSTAKQNQSYASPANHHNSFDIEEWHNFVKFFNDDNNTILENNLSFGNFP